MSGEDFIHSDPDWAPVAQVPNPLCAMGALGAGVAVFPTAAAPVGTDQDKLALHEAAGTGAEPLDRWGSAPGVISHLHVESVAR